jgi:uncharacterized membrane protein SpoIIM required for sporulation
MRGLSLRILPASIQAAKKIKTLLMLVALLYVGSYAAGWYLISIESPIAVQMSESLMQAVLTEQPFTSIFESLRGGDLLVAILITFVVNLTTGAFLTTTLPGIVPLVGILGIVAVTLFRGFVIGVTYPAVLAASPVAFALGMGTMILELGAYVFSGAAGINIALAPILPRRYGVQSRWAAFKMAWKDAARVFIIVVILLALGAIWEMTGLFLVIR